MLERCKNCDRSHGLDCMVFESLSKEEKKKFRFPYWLSEDCESFKPKTNIICGHTDEEIAESFISDVESVKELLEKEFKKEHEN